MLLAIDCDRVLLPVRMVKKVPIPLKSQLLFNKTGPIFNLCVWQLYRLFLNTEYLRLKSIHCYTVCALNKLILYNQNYNV